MAEKESVKPKQQQQQQQQNCNCGLTKKYQEVLEVNKSWHDEYSTLEENYKSLETKYEELLDNKSKQTTKEEIFMPPSLTDDTERTKSFIENEQSIEALKQQLVIYQEDYQQEAREKEDLQKEIQRQKHKINEQNKIITALQQRKEEYKTKYDHVYNDKTYMRNELKRLIAASSSTENLM